MLAVRLQGLRAGPHTEASRAGVVEVVGLLGNVMGRLDRVQRRVGEIRVQSGVRGR